ncbi:hypothetical protein SeMB42_g03660 [Synchytrium endobioticum]|uniref:Uncharacterized protein n=1 Tax=Synchytrium endobioticum TaxID=286115 RepID=A0A507D560_9FUNG|nr:hypothetical protein SeMB42_g03660 [Synchytrium endobioticum]TPX50343.1 hypothetical protein SeLEV6574_g00934 [Synchytrium endobioticum]
MYRVALCKTNLLSLRAVVSLLPKRCYPIYSHECDNDPGLLEREKRRTLKGDVKTVINNAPGWNEALASESEANVKADRSSCESPEALQKETVRSHFTSETSAANTQRPSATPSGQVKQE